MVIGQRRWDRSIHRLACDGPAARDRGVGASVRGVARAWEFVLNIEHATALSEGLRRLCQRPRACWREEWRNGLVV